MTLTKVKVAAVAGPGGYIRPLLVVIALALAGFGTAKLLLGATPTSTGWRYHILGFPVEQAVFRAIHMGSLAMLVAAALLAAVVATKWCRERYRVRNGLCVVCGYDLRASKERCPECGTQ